jgi:hypothetical protein
LKGKRESVKERKKITRELALLFTGNTRKQKEKNFAPFDDVSLKYYIYKNACLLAYL